MSDRELLELAAKAAGLELQTDYSGEIWALAVDDHPEQGVRWNPLADDGDALRLAVKLNIDHGNPGMRLSIDWEPSESPYAATRRAIVLAAAEIGKELP